MNHEKIEKFRQLYEDALRKQIEKDPEEYSYSADKVPVVVEKMLRALEKGPFEISVGPALKSAMRKMGFTSIKKLWQELYGDKE